MTPSRKHPRPMQTRRKQAKTGKMSKSAGCWMRRSVKKIHTMEKHRVSMCLMRSWKAAATNWIPAFCRALRWRFFRRKNCRRFCHGSGSMSRKRWLTENCSLLWPKRIRSRLKRSFPCCRNRFWQMCVKMTKMTNQRRKKLRCPAGTALNIKKTKKENIQPRANFCLRRSCRRGMSWMRMPRRCRWKWCWRSQR